MEILNIKSNTKNEMIDITYSVQKIVKEKGFKDGIIHIFVPHTTAAVTINENADPDVKRDMLKGLDAIIPDIRFNHMEGNSDAHIKSSIIGNTQTIIVENGQLILGTWQGIYFCEFDGPRNRKVYIKLNK